jgi:hypothetical protein
MAWSLGRAEHSHRNKHALVGLFKFFLNICCVYGLLRVQAVPAPCATAAISVVMHPLLFYIVLPKTRREPDKLRRRADYRVGFIVCGRWHSLRRHQPTACSFGWWLIAGADLF